MSEMKVPRIGRADARPARGFYLVEGTGGRGRHLVRTLAKAGHALGRWTDVLPPLNPRRARLRLVRGGAL